MGEHEQETGEQTGQQAEDAARDDGGATAGSTGETGLPADESPGAADPTAEGGEPQVEVDTGGGDAEVEVNNGGEGTPSEEQTDETPDGETQTGADPQPE